MAENIKTFEETLERVSGLAAEFKKYTSNLNYIAILVLLIGLGFILNLNYYDYTQEKICKDFHQRHS